jgi:hypothetical protein
MRQTKVALAVDWAAGLGKIWMGHLKWTWASKIRSIPDVHSLGTVILNPRKSRQRWIKSSKKLLLFPHFMEHIWCVSPSSWKLSFPHPVPWTWLLSLQSSLHSMDDTPSPPPHPTRAFPDPPSLSWVYDLAAPAQSHIQLHLIVIVVYLSPFPRTPSNLRTGSISWPLCVPNIQPSSWNMLSLNAYLLNEKKIWP